jgi:uncharacterized protein
MARIGSPRPGTSQSVDDVDRLVAEVQSHGGRIVRPPFDVPEFGRIVIGADATGAFMAWVTLKR